MQASYFINMNFVSGLEILRRRGEKVAAASRRRVGQDQIRDGSSWIWANWNVSEREKGGKTFNIQRSTFNFQRIPPLAPNPQATVPLVQERTL
jgi:hypothetical protein